MSEAATTVRAVVNGRDVVLPAGATVADVVEAVCASPRGVAVALGREVVPRSSWANVAVPEGAAIEVVSASAGG